MTFVFHGARSRAIALLMMVATALPLVPRTAAVAQPATVAQAETKAMKKKKDTSHTSHHAWTRASWGRTAPQPRTNPIKVVLKTARAQLGKPYRWGATGPSAFDCSGFTSYVWRQAGVEIPRTSSQQYAGLSHVPLKKMRKGDLVFAPGHVGLYLGKGKMIHSPRSGRTVSIDPIHDGTYGAARPSY